MCEVVLETEHKGCCKWWGIWKKCVENFNSPTLQYVPSQLLRRVIKYWPRFAVSGVASFSNNTRPEKSKRILLNSSSRRTAHTHILSTSLPINLSSAIWINTWKWFRPFITSDYDNVMGEFGKSLEDYIWFIPQRRLPPVFNGSRGTFIVFRCYIPWLVIINLLWNVYSLCLHPSRLMNCCLPAYHLGHNCCCYPYVASSLSSLLSLIPQEIWITMKRYCYCCLLCWN